MPRKPVCATKRAIYTKQMENDTDSKNAHLKFPAQLPEIADDPLILVWDAEGDSHGEAWEPTHTVIKHKGQVIWREQAYYECVARFNEVVKVLRQKYGDRLKALIPTRRSETYLYGDIISPSRKATDIATSYSILGVEALAESGDQEAINGLRFMREYESHHLERADQLPEVAGDFLVLSWDLAESPPRVRVQVLQDSLHFEWDKNKGDGFLSVTLSHEGQELWKEAASLGAHFDEKGEFCSDLADRFDELATIAKSKYGARLKDIVPTLRSSAYCGGAVVEETIWIVRSRHFPESQDDVLKIWKAAVAGYPDAQSDVGDLLFLGEGMPKDSTRAAYWCRQAADQGDSHAQSGLGILYEYGDGVPQDDAEAVKWYRKAADQGESYAQLVLGIRYRSGTGVPQDYSKAMDWLIKAADQNQADAYRNLGSMYEIGQGVPQDYVQAYMWFDVASASYEESQIKERGEAIKKRAAVAKKLTKPQIAEAQKLAKERKLEQVASQQS